MNSRESEVRDLLSSISGVSGKDIIGICDKYGTYFTLSYAVNNHNINQEHSEYFFLITASKNDNKHNKNNNINNNNNNYNSCSPIDKNMNNKRQNMKKAEKNKRSTGNNFNSMNNIGNINNLGNLSNMNSMNNMNNMNNLNSSNLNLNNNNLNSYRQQEPRNDYLSYSSSFEPSLNQNIQTNYNYKDKLNNNFQKSKEDNINFNFMKEEILNEEMDKYLSIVNDFLNFELISQISAIRIQKMITEEKFSLISNFKKFIAGKMNLKEFLQSIENNLNEDDIKLETNLRSRPGTAVPNKKNLIKDLDDLPSTIFDDISDHELLKKLVRQSYNEIINSAYEVYLADDDLENFADSLRRIISHHKEESRKNSFSSKLYI